MSHPDAPSTPSLFSRLFRRTACPLPAAGAPCARLRASDLVPLAAFLLPTVAIGYGFVIPRSCIDGVNSLTIGFALTLLSACVTYVVGVRAARRR